LALAQVSDSTQIEEVGNLVFDKAAVPHGGIANYLNWINENNRFKYYSDTLTFHNKVFVEFTVGKDGLVTNVRTVKGIGRPYDQEAIRLLRDHPTYWDPAEQRGKKLASTFLLPVYFVDERPPKETRDKKSKRKH